MSIEVLLMKDVEHLGAEGDIVTVADGYARNYLFTKNIAATVSDVTKRQLAKNQVLREAEREAQVASARERAKKLEGVSCTIAVKTDEDDKMYGSVAVKDILESLKAQGIEVEKQHLQLDSPIKELGVFDIPVKLDKDVEATIKVWVVEE